MGAFDHVGRKIFLDRIPFLRGVSGFLDRPLNTGDESDGQGAVLQTSKQPIQAAAFPEGSEAKKGFGGFFFECLLSFRQQGGADLPLGQGSLQTANGDAFYCNPDQLRNEKWFITNYPGGVEESAAV